LILLGDKDQLASVEVGAVLGDICGQGAPDIFSPEFARKIAFLSGEEIESGNVPAGIQDNIIYLQKNYRFSDQSDIGLLSQTIKTASIRKPRNCCVRKNMRIFIGPNWPKVKNYLNTLAK